MEPWRWLHTASMAQKVNSMDDVYAVGDTEPMWRLYSRGNGCYPPHPHKVSRGIHRDKLKGQKLSQEIRESLQAGFLTNDQHF